MCRLAPSPIQGKTDGTIKARQSEEVNDTQPVQGEGEVSTQPSQALYEVTLAGEGAPGKSLHEAN